MIVKFKNTECDFDNIEQEYHYDKFRGGSTMLKVLHTFDISERRLLILYAELNSTRKVGKMLGISHTKINYVLKDLRQQFMSRMNNLNLDENVKYCS